MSSKSLHLLSLLLAGGGAGATCMLNSMARPAATREGAGNVGKEGRKSRGLGAGMGQGADSGVIPVPGVILEAGASAELSVQEGRGWEQMGHTRSLTRMLSCQ